MDKGPPPPGGDQDQGAKYLIIAAVLTSISIATVSLRFIARTIGNKQLGWDDWTMLAALCLTIALFVTNVFLIRAGLGRHIYYLDLAQVIRFGKAVFVTELLSNLILCLVKLSVVLFLLRIGGIRRWLRAILFTIIAFLISSSSATIIILFVQCRPIAGNWDPRLASKANCLSTSVLADVSYCSAASSVLTDFLCAALPFQIIGDLQMSRGNKISLLAVLTLGFLAMICGIVRMTFLKTLNSTDSSWIEGSVGGWTFAELSVGIIAGSIPPCRVLVLQIIYNLRGEATSNENIINTPSSRSGHSFPLKSLSRITNAVSRGRASGEAPRVSKSPKSSQKKYVSAKRWNREANRPVSQESGRESILPLHSVPEPSLETSIFRTVDVVVGTGERAGEDFTQT